MIGNAQGARDAAVAYLKERKQFGKTLSEFQGFQFQVAQDVAFDFWVDQVEFF